MTGPSPAPYTQTAREMWLRRVLQAQRWVRENGPEQVRSIELVTVAELAEIRRIWVVEKHEIEDLLPGIYEDETGDSYPDAGDQNNGPLGSEGLEALKEVCGDDSLHYELTPQPPVVGVATPDPAPEKGALRRDWRDGAAWLLRRRRRRDGLRTQTEGSCGRRAGSGGPRDGRTARVRQTFPIRSLTVARQVQS